MLIVCSLFAKLSFEDYCKKQKMAEDSVLSAVGAHFSLDPVALKNEWALMINDKAMMLLNPTKFVGSLLRIEPMFTLS